MTLGTTHKQIWRRLEHQKIHQILHIGFDIIQFNVISDLLKLFVHHKRQSEIDRPDYGANKRILVVIDLRIVITKLLFCARLIVYLHDYLWRHPRM